MKILVYDDNPEYGGHQIMACHGIEALAADPANEIICMINPANRKLKERLSGFRILDPATDIKPLNAELVLCLQGDITQCTQGIQAAKRAGTKCVSYLAVPHRLASMGAKLGAVRDVLNRHLLNGPDRYIAISESMKKILVERGCTKPVTVVQNGIPTSPIRKNAPAGSRFTLGLIGRIEFKQKQQDFMVRTFQNHPEAFNDCQLLIAGRGPDEDKLRQLISEEENIELLPWQEDPQSFYGQIDMLIIPSRFEGVPLVMLEALARGIPVIGSARDGMRDILPRNWIFETENSDALAETFSNVRKSWPDEIGALQSRVLSDHALETFKTNFVNAVVKG